LEADAWTVNADREPIELMSAFDPFRTLPLKADCASVQRLTTDGTVGSVGLHSMLESLRMDIPNRSAIHGPQQHCAVQMQLRQAHVGISG
jgi:hypothetical protein